MTLAKSNNVLIFFSLLLTLWYFHQSIKIAITDCIKSGLTLLIVILPWSYFISVHNNTVILTSVLGPQALVSFSGLRNQPLDSILGKVIGKYHLYNEKEYKEFREAYKNKPNPCKGKII